MSECHNVLTFFLLSLLVQISSYQYDKLNIYPKNGFNFIMFYLA